MAVLTAVSTVVVTAVSAVKTAVSTAVGTAVRVSEIALSSSGRAVQGFKVLCRKVQTSHDERESSFTILQLATTILQPYYNPILQPHTTTPLLCSFVMILQFGSSR